MIENVIMRALLSVVINSPPLTKLLKIKPFGKRKQMMTNKKTNMNKHAPRMCPIDASGGP